jgi:hypothetical protein
MSILDLESTGNIGPHAVTDPVAVTTTAVLA